MNLPRTLEPECMDVMEEAIAYLEMDHSVVNQRFVEDLFAGGPVGPRVIDLGCGPALIMIEIAKRDSELQLMGIDSSVEMLDLAKMQIDLAGMLYRISLEHADAKEMQGFQDEMSDTVVSNTLLHHLEAPESALRSAMRLTKTGGRLFIRDLMRPDCEEVVEELVQLHAKSGAIEGDGAVRGEAQSGEIGPSAESQAAPNPLPSGDTVAQQLLRQSLHAALTLEEIESIAGNCGIERDCVTVTSDRHWTLDWTRV